MGGSYLGPNSVTFFHFSTITAGHDQEVTVVALDTTAVIQQAEQVLKMF